MKTFLIFPDEVKAVEESKLYNYVEKIKDNDLDLPNITEAITEIELDNALIDSSPSLGLLGQDTPSLADSGSSNSSELGKLTECMKTLKEKQLKLEHLDNENQTQRVDNGTQVVNSIDANKKNKSVSQQTTSTLGEERETLKIDLRTKKKKVRYQNFNS